MKYKTKINIYYNSKVYRKGETVEMKETEAKKFGDFIEVLRETAGDNDSENKSANEEESGERTIHKRDDKAVSTEQENRRKRAKIKNLFRTGKKGKKK